MNKICEDNKCTGCGLCANICPVNAISLELNNEGFYIPNINNDKCINCLLCEKKCKELNVKNYPITAYKAKSINKEVLINSTSGGIFSELAKKIIIDGGVVFGAVFSENQSVKHVEIDTIDKISAARGSKYIGSRVGLIYKRIKELLKQNKKVLFTGTSCQCAAVKKFCYGINDNNLYLCDFVCHGVASEKVFKMYLDDIEKRQNSKIEQIYFRCKDFGYELPQFKVVLKNKNIIYPSYESSFGYAFASGMINRKSCSLCEFATLERVSDISICDLKYDIDDIDKKEGISLCLINSSKMLSMFNEIEVNKEVVSIDFCVKAQMHLSKPTAEHFYRKKIFKKIHKISYDKLSRKYMIKPKNNLINKIKYKLWALKRSK